MPRIALSELAFARAGDKGDKVNIGVAARDPRLYPALCDALQPAAIKDWFGALCTGPVQCYPLSNLSAVNVVLNGALDGGSAKSLRIDNQGKAMGDTLLMMEVEVPDEVSALAHTLATARRARS